MEVIDASVSTTMLRNTFHEKNQVQKAHRRHDSCVIWV